MSEVLLSAKGLTAGFGGNQVLHGIDLEIRVGEAVGIFGLNGAGKSVTLKVIAGLLRPWAGAVEFAGRDVTRAAPERRVGLGMGHVPQGRQVFPRLTVEENLRLGAYTSRRRDRATYPQRLERVYEQFPLLAERRRQVGGTLSGGEQAALAVGRALINEPRLILVDEPSAGLAPAIVGYLLRILRDVAASGVTILLVEQNVAFGLQLVDRAQLMQNGRIVHSAPVDELDTETLAARLGIGRMLSATTSAALASRTTRPVKSEAPRRRSRPLRAPGRPGRPVRANEGR
jgi:branched-chain amino acid transport system ATP-binding protein